MKRLFIIILLLFVYNSVSVFADSQKDNYKKAKKLFELSIKTTDQKVKTKYRKQIIKISPDSEYGWYSKAYLKNLKGNYKGAIRDCTRAIKINSKDAFAFSNRGNAKLMLGKRDEACLDFRKARELGMFQAKEMIKQHCK